MPRSAVTGSQEPARPAAPPSGWLAVCPVSRGDGIEAVKQVYGISTDPKKLDQVTPSGTAFLYRLQAGVWVFFDERQRVLSLRFDAPFRGRIGGVAIGDSAKAVMASRGSPASEFRGFPLPGTGRSTAAWVYDATSPSFVRYDLYEDRVRSIIVNSCPS